MAANTDPFDELFSVEDDYYKQGYDAGVADATYAGLVEGKLFGVEKGFEKALELGKLHGRALVWKARTPQPAQGASDTSGHDDSVPDVQASKGSDTHNGILPELEMLNANPRLLKNIDTLLMVTGSKNIDMTNSDVAVAAFEERLAKAQAKAKIIANVLGETLTNPNHKQGASSGIEEAGGLNARH